MKRFGLFAAVLSLAFLAACGGAVPRIRGPVQPGSPTQASAALCVYLDGPMRERVCFDVSDSFGRHHGVGW